MRNTGKDLEALVALIEKFHLPPGFEITTNDRVYNDDKIQIAEFDIQVKGRLGTTDLLWLIECRDRPSEGAAPRSWIEQLMGRRIASGFNKVTAVSTTGFAAGASELAQEQGIEIREVRSLTAEHFADWLKIETIPGIEQLRRLVHATLILAPDEPDENRQAVDEVLAKNRSDQPILRAVKTNQTASLNTAFSAELSSREDVFDAVVPNTPARPLRMRVIYPDDGDYFVVDTHLGAVRIRQIVFDCELAVKETEVPLAGAREYFRADSGKSISQSAAFVFDALGATLSLEMHKLAETGETHIVLRKLGEAAKPAQTP
jgi:hypothetical protein